ncbi:MAG: hypothetical protein FWE91_00835 [Defluviitaleaceae bacterium]|nr:hypothetical protein [Defluviitaleaceae bacterium]MCL2835409.1 hypothetical protein [Defluviitaleaceae bacterium]
MNYINFRAATYAPAEYLHNTPVDMIRADIEKVGRYVKLDKIYLETYRTDTTVERDKMEAVKELFTAYGFQLAGGVTTTTRGSLMWSMCFTDPENRKKLGDIAAYTAELFDEIMFDDFYFTNCRCELCIQAKGERDWASFRMDLMNDVSENIVIKRAKEVNPGVHLIIKYPNWYESFPACGYNPEDETRMFGSIYTGTETRDPHYTHQNLQRYLSYFLPRLMERVKPGLNGGGWYDLFECDLDDYVQQAYLTIFAKCRENMLFCLPLLARFPAVYAAAAGAAFDETDMLMGKMGEPIGVACYKPYHSYGERHLYDFLGMLGIPLDPYPEYPLNAPVIILTASAAWDGDIISKIKQSLLDGSRVFVTGGLYDKLKHKGMQDILPLEVTGKSVTADMFSNNGYGRNYESSAKAAGSVTMPRITYSTNDIWVLSAGLTPYASHPLLLCGSYGKGFMYVLNIPDMPADLYKLPAETLTLLRGEMKLPVTLESGAHVGLFLYDNSAFILQSFLDKPEKARLRISLPGVELESLTGVKASKARSGEGESVFEITLMPGWYGAFRVKS